MQVACISPAQMLSDDMHGRQRCRARSATTAACSKAHSLVTVCKQSPLGASWGPRKHAQSGMVGTVGSGIRACMVLQNRTAHSL